MIDVPESHRDLLQTQVATLATVDGQGLPQLTEVWFLFEDGDLKISLNETRRKTRNLVERPECSLLILDLQNPYRYLEVRGDDCYATDQAAVRRAAAASKTWQEAPLGFHWVADRRR